MLRKEIKKLDRLWSKLIRDNFKNKCVLCGNHGNNPHHYVGRRNRATRWYIENGILLCALHHTFGIKSAHQDPEWFRKQILDIWGNKWLKDLVKRSNKVCKSDYETVKDYLEGNRNNY